MRLALPVTAALIALAAPALAADPIPADSPVLAKALAGRTAGAPQDCIALSTQARSSTIVDSTAIIYRESSRRWWVNRPQGGCPPLQTGRSLVTVTPGARLCRMDPVRVVDLVPPGFDYGQCALGDFTPYTR